jgi:glycosyltransferase involved in cell wall biosynthesis
MNNAPLVSICCTVYNHEPYLHDCFEGFVMQKTNFPFEILVHDDASTDKSADIIREYTAKYPGLFKPIYQTENQHSQGKNPNSCYLFPRVQSKYIALCEGDDYWIDPYKLQKQVDFLEKNDEYGLVHTAFKTVGPDGGEIEMDFYKNIRLLTNKEFAFTDMLIYGLKIMTLSVCLRTSLMTDFSEWFVYDYWRFLDVARKSKIHYINEEMVAYRIHQASLMRSNQSFVTKRIQWVKLDMFRRYLEDKEANYCNVDKEIAMAFGVCFREQIRQYKGKYTKEYFKILLRHPFLIKYIFRRCN